MIQFPLFKRFSTVFMGMLLLAFMISFIACKSDSSASQEEGMTDETEMTDADMGTDADMDTDADMAEKGPDHVYDVVDEMPHFPGCEAEEDLEARTKCSNEKLYEFIYKHLTYPEAAKEEGIEGTTMVQFVVDKSGAIRDVEMLKTIGGGCDEETQRVITAMQEEGITWNPGIQNGEAVNVKLVLPVKYELE